MEHLKIITNGISGTKNIISNLPTTNTNVYNKQILDPLTTLIKLAILAYKQKGTKVSIHTNHISFQTPDFLQGTWRWKNGDNRYDLHNLCNPIERGVEWYDCHTNKNIHIIFTLAIKGLKRLKESYKDLPNTSLVCDAISHYISILEKRLEDVNKPESVSLQTKLENNINTSLREMWDLDEIAIISSMLTLAQKKKYEQDISYIIAGLEKIIEGKDNYTHQIILKYTTSL